MYHQEHFENHHHYSQIQVLQHNHASPPQCFLLALPQRTKQSHQKILIKLQTIENVFVAKFYLQHQKSMIPLLSINVLMLIQLLQLETLMHN